MEIKERLRQLRTERNETQEAVAEVIGVSEQHYKTFEYGKHLKTSVLWPTTLASVWIIWRAGRTSVETEQMREGELA